MKIFSGTQSNYDTGIVSDERSWSASLECSYEGYWRTIPSNCLKTFTLSDNATNGSNISMGDVLGGELQTSFINITIDDLSLLKEGRQVRIKLTLENADVTLVSKIFIVDSAKIKRRGDTYNAEITAYDPTYKMTYTYVANAEKMTALQVVTQIANKYGLGVDASVSDAIAAVDGSTPYQFTMLADFTDKDTLGYMAGCYGCNASVNEEHNICFVWYESTNEEIRSDRVYMGGQYVSEMESRTIVMLETGTKDNPITYPSVATGHSINYENPYITATQAEAIYNAKIADGKIKFNVGKTKYKGNPLNGAGKIVKVFDTKNEEATVYIMKRKLTYGGGLSETIECLGESETSTRYSISSPTQQRIDRALSKMEEAIKSATDAITQTKGSVFEFIPVDENDPTQGNAGYNLRYKDNTDPAFDDCLIQATAGGIGFSTDNGKTFDGAAMYFYKDESGEVHGAVNSEFLRAGSITADKLAADSITADKIKAGAVTADKVQAGAITAEKLSVGSAKESNMFNNNEFTEHYRTVSETGYEYDKIIGWSTDNSYLAARSGIGRLFPNSNTEYGFKQAVWIPKGKYAFIFKINVINPISLGENPDMQIITPRGTGTYPQVKIDADTVTNGMNRYVVFKVIFNNTKEASFSEVGVKFLDLNLGTGTEANYGYLDIDWVILVPSNEDAGFYCSNTSWLINNEEIREQYTIPYYADSASYFKSVNPFQINESGKLKVVEGQIGGFSFIEHGFSAAAHVYIPDDYGESSSVNTKIEVKLPFGSWEEASLSGEDFSEVFGELAPRIIISSDESGDKTVYGFNYLRFETETGNSTYISEQNIITTGKVDAKSIKSTQANFTTSDKSGLVYADDISAKYINCSGAVLGSNLPKKISWGVVEGVTSSGSSVSLSGFSSNPTVICTPLQTSAANTVGLTALVSNLSTTSFTVRMNVVSGEWTYGTDIMWIALGS